MPATVATELVSCRQLVCGYAGAPVIGPLSFCVRSGEVVAILGGSGAGKSTLLRTLLGLLPPLAGEVSLLGQDLAKLDAARRRRLYRRIGVSYQGDALLASLSVLENVVLPLRELPNVPEPVIHRAGRARLSLLEVLATEARLPSQISGGQAKRVGLARATILDPMLLFCDEPTSGLDPLTAAQIDRVLLRFRSVFGTTILAVTHDIDTARTISDRVLVLGRRGLLAQGSIAELERHADLDVRSFFGRAGTPAEGGEGRT
jgi:phospholipid/cholesterol/gamma-HCH transport system ATP-binding protein